MTIGLKTSRRLIVAGAGALLLAGCAGSGGMSEKTNAAARHAAEVARQTQHERTLNAAWQGKPYDALRQHFGDPPLLMNVIGARPLRTSLVVYTENINEAHCIDAFTMVKIESSGQWLVADYFCR
jgi:hypothetical protein